MNHTVRYELAHQTDHRWCLTHHRAATHWRIRVGCERPDLNPTQLCCDPKLGGITLGCRFAKAEPLFDIILEDTRKAFNSALNDWLKECVRKWCPLAFEVAESNPAMAAQILADKDFHWTQDNATCDLVATFWQNDTPIMRCRLEVRLLNPEWHKLGPSHDWCFMFHPEALKNSTSNETHPN